MILIDRRVVTTVFVKLISNNSSKDDFKYGVLCVPYEKDNYTPFLPLRKYIVLFEVRYRKNKDGA